MSLNEYIEKVKEDPIATFERLHPNAPKRNPKTAQINLDNKFSRSNYDRTLIYNMYRKIFEKINGFEESELKKYHKIYNTISNKIVEYKNKITDVMNSNKTPNEKWESYKKITHDAIDDWNREHSSNPSKLINKAELVGE